MAKNIVVLSDGTGQEGGRDSAHNTNVYRIFNMLENRTSRQMVFYDQGIGTGWRKVTGMVGGAGISRNIREAYRFILDHYEIGDRIFLLGFSRGAATVRSLSGFIDLFGILPKGRPELIKVAYKIYKTRAPAFKWVARQTLKSWKLENLLPYEAPDNDDDDETSEAFTPPPRRLADHLWPGNLDELEASIDAAMDSIHSRWNEPVEEQAEEVGKPSAQSEVQHLIDRREYYDQMLDDITDSATEILLTYSKKNTSDPREFLRAVKRKKKAMAFLLANHSQPAPIEFLGCFDTVAALGLPFPAFDAILNRIPGFQHKFHHFGLSRCVRHAYHALALDDEREPFKPVPWTVPVATNRKWKDRGGVEVTPYRHECDSPDCDEQEMQTLRQVWFSGMHTDVGGGYPHRGLSDITLAWMLRQAHTHGVLLNTPQARQPQEPFFVEDPSDVMAESRQPHEPIGEGPRDVMGDSRGTRLKKLLYKRQRRTLEGFDSPKPLVHESVLERMKALKEEEVVATGASFKALLVGDPTNQNKEGFDKDDWVRHDSRQLMADQEAKWDKWLARLAAKERARRQLIAHDLRESHFVIQFQSALDYEDLGTNYRDRGELDQAEKAWKEAIKLFLECDQPMYAGAIKRLLSSLRAEP